MIIQALAKYYDILATMDDTGSIPVYGYAFCKADFCLTLATDGKLLSVADLREGRERKELIMPFLGDHTNSVNSFFAWDNNRYALGLPLEDKKNLKRFRAFVDLHNQLLSDQEDEEVQALLGFINSWQPEEAKNNQEMAPYFDDIIKGANIVFRLQGKVNYLHDSPCIKQVWEHYIKNREVKAEGYCLVSGKKAPIELTHSAIKNVMGANAKGGAIVSYNNAAFCSYHKEQSANGPIGIHSAFAYTTALNYLLSDPKHRMIIDNMTIVYWAERTNKIYHDLSRYFINPKPFIPKDADEQSVQYDAEMRDLVHDILLSIRQGRKLDEGKIAIDEDVNFYILGLTANNARLAVSFWYSNTFGKFIRHVAQHHLDMEICNSYSDKNVRFIGDILRETVPKDATDKKAPTVFTAPFLRAILNNQLYPARVYAKILGRIGIDKDINPIRAGFIKAYLLRKSKIYKSLNKEEITVVLNKESESAPYRLGRLFAVLEKAQKEAVGNDINATIKDKYFGSAMTTPAAVFPTLIKLSSHHTSKAEYGYALENLKAEILSGMETTCFPSRLTLDEQGMFALGYYHQVADFYTKKNKETKEEK
jgi:CRISPR-associated protein Csd1